ncbi:MAG: DNA replication and repair protein RecF [Treponema sp.]|jgi:DNA replication and repair protein RecF|nr:DNA replication and repair protein RecF [Treponema sp.]
MAVLVLRTSAFRNLADGEITTKAKDVFLVGGNGQGKTNFLEALYFCSYGSSFRGVKDRELARGGEGDFSASAESVDHETVLPLPVRIAVKVEKSRKTITLDGKKIEDRKDLLKIIPCVAFCHEDMEFVSGTQEKRRWFFDQTQSLYDLVYLEDLRRYRRVLKNRNTVLRDSKMGGNYREAAEMLDVLDPQLAEYGLRLMEKRRLAAEQFSAVFGPLYQEVSGIAGIGVSYVPSWKAAGRDAVLRRLTEHRAADLAQGITLSGLHRDRYMFVRNTRNEASAGSRKDFAETASTGQRRLLALLLRVAQARCFSENSGKTPVLLLDDVLLELDGEKRQRFLSVMPAYEQAFFTFLPEEPYKRYCRSDTLVYHVSNGVISG